MRHRKWIVCLVITGGALGLLPATAPAQADSIRWQGIPLHARVRVTTPGAREIRGTLAGWTDSSLTIRTPPEVMIGLHEIQRLRVARGHRLGRGLLLGVGIGVLSGVVLGISVGEQHGEVSQAGFTALAAGYFGVLGGGVGALAGGLTTRWSDVPIPNR